MTNSRRTRFLRYFNEGPLKGSREALIRRTGLTKGRISQLFDEAEPFGERAASGLAEKLGLPPDYFERDQPNHVYPLVASVPGGQVLALSADEHRLLRDMRDLLPEDLERIMDEIHTKAEQMRKHAALVLKRAGIGAATGVTQLKPQEWDGKERRSGPPQPVPFERREGDKKSG